VASHSVWRRQARRAGAEDYGSGREVLEEMKIKNQKPKIKNRNGCGRRTGASGIRTGYPQILIFDF
jgi:hypothetical protein